MKWRFIFIFFTTILSGSIFLNFSSGAAASLNQDRTGSPLSVGGCNVIGCHSAGAFGTSVALEILENDMPITAYLPETMYQMRVTISTSTGTPGGYGFQAVALSGDGNDQAGTFSNPPTGVQISALNGRQYPEHSSRRPDSVFVVDWMSPAIGTGDISFYASGNAVNGNGNSQGDGAISLEQPFVLTEADPSSIAEINGITVELNTFPNPVTDILNVQLSSDQQTTLQLRLTDLSGRVLEVRRIQMLPGETTERMQLSQYAPGAYTVILSDGKAVLTEKILKY